LKHIRSKPESLLKGASIALLSASRIEEILKDEKVEADEYTLFRILQAWANISKNEEKDDEETPASGQECETRKREAAEMMEYVSLNLIDPTDLSTTVASSGLVTTD
jgi:hypothetical protein